MNVDNSGMLPKKRLRTGFMGTLWKFFLWFLIISCVAVAFGFTIMYKQLSFCPVPVPGDSLQTGDDNGEDTYVTALLSDGIRVIDDRETSLTMGFWPGIPIYLEIDSRELGLHDLHFEISASLGEFWCKGSADDGYLGNPVSLANEKTIFWNLTTKEVSSGISIETVHDRVYTYIVIYEEENIVGYAVVAFDRLYGKEFVTRHPEFAEVYEDDDPVRVYDSSILEAVIFPRIDGEYQAVTMEYIMECFGRII